MSLGRDFTYDFEAGLSRDFKGDFTVLSGAVLRDTFGGGTDVGLGLAQAVEVRADAVAHISGGDALDSAS